ncbi:MAG: hypothetical protein QW117_01040 [Candidatus Pacearchaeota archaeon]
MNKKGQQLLEENIIFLILNMIIFVTLLIFVYNSSNGKLIDEQYYAKEIALLINSAEPNTTIYFDLSYLYKKYEKEIEKGILKKENLIKINNEKGIVYFSLNPQTYYSYYFFNNVKINTYFEDNHLILKIESYDKK